MLHYIKYFKTICKCYPAFLLRPSIYLEPGRETCHNISYNIASAQSIQSSQGTIWTAKDSKRLQVHSEDCDQTAYAQADRSLRLMYMQLCRKLMPYLFVLWFYGPVNPWGHVKRGQFTYTHFYWAGLVL